LLQNLCCLLTEEQNNKHVNVFHDLQEQLKNDHQFLTKVVTGDERWCYGYDPESKQQSSQRKSPKSTASSLKCQENVYFFLMLMG
jgi:hypothetical protein